jgi:tetratricopeptide (TPR) repeat protein
MLAHIGHRAEWRGDFRTAIAYTEECIVVANDNGMPSAGLFGQWFLGISYGAIGEYGKSVDMLGAGLDLCERIGDRALKARLLNTMGWLHAEFGCHARASEFNRMGTDIAREMVDLGLVAGAPELYANAAINLAGNLIALGEPNAAQEQLDAVQQQVDADDDPWMNWRYSLHLLRAQARLDLAQGDPQSAIGKLDQVLAGARGHSAKKLEALALELRGRAYSWMDQRGAARTALEEALTLAQSIEHPPVVWRAHSLLGELDRRDENAAGAAGRFADARALIEEKSRTLRDDSLRGEFRAVADLLKSDPIGSYR